MQMLSNSFLCSESVVSAFCWTVARNCSKRTDPVSKMWKPIRRPRVYAGSIEKSGSTLNFLKNYPITYFRISTKHLEGMRDYLLSGTPNQYMYHQQNNIKHSYPKVVCSHCCLWIPPLALQVVEAVMVTSGGKGRFSAHILAASILKFYEDCKLFPRGMTSNMECVELWSLKNGRAMQRLATRLIKKTGISLNISFTKFFVSSLIVSKWGSVWLLENTIVWKSNINRHINSSGSPLPLDMYIYKYICMYMKILYIYSLYSSIYSYHFI